MTEPLRRMLLHLSYIMRCSMPTPLLAEYVPLRIVVYCCLCMCVYVWWWFILAKRYAWNPKPHSLAVGRVSIM